MAFILTIDLGATKLATGLFNTSKGIRAPIWEKTFPSSSFASLENALENVLAEVPFKQDSIAIGVPGPTSSQSFFLTNLPWEINIKKIQKKFSKSSIHILNDVEAASYSVLSMPKKKFLAVHEARVEKNSVKALVSFGTGVGESFIVPCGTQWKAHPTERGHAPFTAFDERDDKLLEKIHKKKVASTEEVMGKGALSRLYSVLKPSKKILKPEEVAGLASHGDEYAIDAIEWYLELVAREAQKVALSFLPKGGIFLAGGVIHALYPWANPQKMTKVFLDHPVMQKLLREIPLSIITEKDCSLWGLATYSLKEM